MSASGSNSSSDLLSPKSESVSDISEGTGEDEGMSAGKDLGTCGMIEKDLAGAKSSSVKTWGLKG